MGDKDTMAYMEDVPVDVDNDYHPFRYGVDYAWAKFLQASKMLKGSMGIFFSDLDLVPIRERLSYKNVDEMQALLTELLYGKVTWWTKILSICSVIANVALKEYLMYYLDIIPAIRFLIGNRLFAPHMAFVPVRRYSTNNPDNDDINGNKDERIYGEMHTAD